MKANIETQLENGLELASKKFEGDRLVEKFSETIKIFDDLVSKGFANKRGNNLLSPSDVTKLQNITYNVCEEQQ